MDINNFGPFKAETWGTISDWFAVLVYGITGYLIWRTLKSQQIVQSLQQKSTAIENERFRIEIIPIFKLDITERKFEKIETQIKVEISMGFYPEENDCLNLTINPNPVSGLIKETQILPNKLDYLVCNGRRILLMTIMSEISEFDRNGIFFQLNFEFTDLVGNAYHQVFDIGITYTDTYMDFIGPFRKI